MALGYVLSALLAALKPMRTGGPFDLGAAVARMLRPERAVDWVDLVGPPIAGLIAGFAVAAYLAARRGVVRGPAAAA
jgi:PAT family beta-lactamase induction signal transducer AmpG